MNRFVRAPQRGEAQRVFVLYASLLSCAPLLSCAEGYAGIEAVRQSQSSPPASPGGGGSGLSGVGGTGGRGGGAGTAGSSMPPGMTSTGMGEPCLRGETVACTCVDKGTMGTKICVFDAASPLDGFYGDCARCPDPAPPPSDPGDVMTSGTGGSGGSSGSGGSGSAGRSGSGGSGGSGGSTPPPPPPTMGGGSRSCASPCNQPCFPIGILACCNPLGICGCSWAPGAYCL